MKHSSVALVFLLLAGCDTVVRVPGLSLAFPETATGYVATARVADTLAVLPSVDSRASNMDRDVAGAGWMACKTDTLPNGEVPKLVDLRLQEALQAAKIYASVSFGSDGSWTLEPEILVFCSQTRGFVWRRVVGLVSVRFTLRHGGQVAWQQTIERVVTDADPEYSGWQITTVEQAMRRTMADSLRLVLRDCMRQLAESVRKT